MKQDRNKPCPCGSGRKFKKCCVLGDKSGNILSVEMFPEVQLKDVRELDSKKISMERLSILTNIVPNEYTKTNFMGRELSQG
jgi:hypothetical protein